MTLRDTFELELVGSAPPGWTTGHMKIHAKRPEEEDGPVITEAWIKGAFAIHLTKGGGARLSHIPTGMGIWTFDNPDLAVECAENIEGFANWQEVGVQSSDGKLYKKVRPVIDRIELQD